MNYTIDKKQKWDFENGFYLTCGKERMGKLLSHYHLYKKIIDLPGDIIEFGVYKGTSLMRFLYFRDLLENQSSRKIIGFDIFGQFPQSKKFKEDQKFIKKFENAGGYGISEEELKSHIEDKSIDNVELVKGDISQSLPNWLEKNPHKRFSIVHIDVDVYEPTAQILELLYDKVVKGGLIILDDYGTVLGETLAVEEFFKKRNIQPELKKLNFYHIPTYFIKP